MALGFGLALTSYRKAAAAAAGAVTDPYFPYVPLLLNTTSTDGQQNNTFLDSSSNAFTITRNGTPTQGSFTPYLPNGYWSNYFNGSTDYVSAASNTAFDMGAGDFTIECWIRGGAQNSFAGILGRGTSDPGRYVLNFGSSGTNIEFYVNQISPSFPVAASTATVNDNKWHHVAAVRSSNVFTLYIDGVAGSTTTTNSVNISTITAAITVGCIQYAASTTYYTGNISNVRVVKGVAVYTGNFTPPTAPLASTQSSGTNISAITGTATSLLTSQSNRFIDNSTNAVAVTATGTPKVQAFQPFSPAASYSAATYGGSGYFNGSTDYLSVPDNAALDLGASDFTLEGWFNFSSLPSNMANLFCKWSASKSYTLYLFNSSGVYNLYFSYSTNGSAYTDVGPISFTPSVGAWNHIAVCRSSTNLVFYVNGSQRGATQVISGALFDSTVPLLIGSLDATVNCYFNGYASNIRVVKGTAVYTGSTYTVPTIPVTAVSGTSLLTNFANAGIYDAAWQNDVTTVGDAQSSTTQSKWSPTSMKYDGTGDWLTAIDSPGLQLGSGDFTIEGWVYLSATGVAYGLISKGTASTGWSVNVTSGNKLQFSYTSSNLTSATSLSASTWYYFAVVRSGTATGNLKVYLNGTVDATSGGAVTDNFNQTSTLYTGADRVGGSALNGYLQDIRITKGVARTITTPTAAFPTR
jgi:hypothetical protein